MPLTAPVLTTARLVLRPQRYSDFQLLADLYTTQRSRFIGGPLAASAVWQGFMNTVGQWPILGMGGWAIDLVATGQTVGEVAVTHPPQFPEPELGWLLFAGHEGNGYATEAAGAALQHARTDIKPASLVSYIDPQNAPSSRLAQRLGAVLDTAAPTPNGDPCLVLRYW